MMYKNIANGFNELLREKIGMAIKVQHAQRTGSHIPYVLSKPVGTFNKFPC